MARSVIITSFLEYPVDIQALLKPGDYIVCLDGGYDIALAQGIRPNLLLGDFDSVSAGLPVGAEADGIEIRRYPPEKDYTDLELAFRVLDPGATPELLVIGGLGGRLDQTAINLQMLARYTAAPAEGPESGEKTDAAANADADPKYVRIEIIDGHNRCFAVHGDPSLPQEARRLYRIPAEAGCYLSLLPINGDCCGVSLQGVKYPLDQAVLRWGASLGTSNEFREHEAVLGLESGCLLVITTRGNQADRI